MEQTYMDWLLFPEDLSPAYFVRTKVFVEEQKCPPEVEFDVIDKISEHAVLYDHGKNPIGTARIYERTPGQASIGRVAVLKEYRGKGHGAYIVEKCIERLEEQGYESILIHAQTYAIPFYERLGFEAFGEEFIEDDIPHIKMMWYVK